MCKSRKIPGGNDKIYMWQYNLVKQGSKLKALIGNMIFPILEE